MLIDYFSFPKEQSCGKGYFLQNRNGTRTNLERIWEILEESPEPPGIRIFPFIDGYLPAPALLTRVASTAPAPPN